MIHIIAVIVVDNSYRFVSYFECLIYISCFVTCISDRECRYRPTSESEVDILVLRSISLYYLLF